MKIVHISTYERAGGAAIAAARLHTGLRRLGHESTLLVRDRTLDDVVAGTMSVPRGEHASLSTPLLERVLQTLFTNRQKEGQNRFFSTDLPTRDLAGLRVVQDAEVINVHWTPGTLSAAGVRRIQDLGKPVVWTLHDQFPFTGGCHYSGDCVGYTTGCLDCPEMSDGTGLVPSLLLEHKREWLDVARLTVVCPSEWLAACARRSLLLGNARVHTIPNGVPVSTYQRLSREEARKRFALPRDAVVVLLGSQQLDDIRKGHHHVMAALERLSAAPPVRQRLADRTLVFAAFGAGSLVQGGVPVLSLGRLVGDEQMAAAYRAADVFVLPALEDNLPNTLLESIAAGTPVVAYATGGIPDVLVDGACGVLVPRGDVHALERGIDSLVSDPGARQRMRAACDAFARERLDLTVQAGAYLRLYGTLLQAASTARDTARHAPFEESAGTFQTRVAAREATLLAQTLALPAVLTALLERLYAQLDEQGGIDIPCRADSGTTQVTNRHA